jgi:hypothetical protein
MSQATSYSNLYPLMRPELPRCDTPVILQALQKAGRRFCEDTDAFQETLDLIRVVDYKQDYTLSHAYNANIHRLFWLKLNGTQIASCDIELWTDTKIRFRRNASPRDQVSMALFCGTAGVLAVFTAVTNGSTGFTICGSTYQATGMNFSSCTSMDDVAQVVQTAIRTALDSDEGLVEYNDKTLAFTIYAESSEVSYLTAGTTGTDISGATLLNGLTGASATLGAYLQAKVSFLPWLTTDTLPDWFFERYSTAVLSKAMSDLLSMRGKPWSNKARANDYALDYMKELNRARKDEITQFTDSGQEAIP